MTESVKIFSNGTVKEGGEGCDEGSIYVTFFLSSTLTKSSMCVMLRDGDKETDMEK